MKRLDFLQHVAAVLGLGPLYPDALGRILVGREVPVDRPADDVTHVVTGWMRCGTSAMMGALVAGGMDADYTPRPYLNDRHGDGDRRSDGYKLNEKFFELTKEEYRAPDFPQAHRGKLIKALSGGAAHMMPVASGSMRVVLMRRHPEEIRQSFEAAFPRSVAPAWLMPHYDTVMDRLAVQLRNRRDVRSVAEVEYRNMMLAPGDVMVQLRRLGWPIDPERAAAYIDPGKYRFRLENLEVGI